MPSLMFPYQSKSWKVIEKFTNSHTNPETKHSESHIRKKRRRIMGDIFFVVLCSNLLSLCDAEAGAEKRLRGDHYNEFHSLLSVIALLICITGIFICLWCTCCGHHDYFTIMDRQRFHEQNKNGDDV